MQKIRKRLRDVQIHIRMENNENTDRTKKNGFRRKSHVASKMEKVLRH